MTIKDTVEGRILDLQERKRQLADATIEGKTKAAKLTMEDMLKLFRHDAEHEHKVDGLGLDWGTKKRVLKENASSGSGSDRERERGEGQGGSHRNKEEHAVYGRRW